MAHSVEEPSRKSDLKIRTVNDISDEYSVWDVIGTGSQGIVYKATNKRTNRLVAIKSLPNTREGDISAASEREIVLMKQCRHPCIISIEDTFQWNNRVNIVLELQPVDALRILRRGLDTHTWTTSAAFKILHCVISAVRYLHESLICHRDIKLENILVDGDGAKLCDFGLAEKLADENQQLCVGKGSIHYAAPEVLSGHVYDGFRADMWSVGVVAHGLLIGKLPFLSNSNSVLKKKIIDCDYALPDNLHPDCRDFLARLIAKNPHDRLTAKEVMQHSFWSKACQRLSLEENGIPGYAVTPVVPVVRAESRNSLQLSTSEDEATSPSTQPTSSQSSPSERGPFTDHNSNQVDLQESTDGRGGKENLNRSRVSRIVRTVKRALSRV